MTKRSELEKLRRLELAHMLKGIRVKNDAPPDKLAYHVAAARDCRAKIEYLNNRGPK